MMTDTSPADNSLPEGWTHERIKAVIEYYDNRTEEEELADLEAAWASESDTLVSVPKALVPAVRSLIAHYESLQAS